MPAKWNDIRRVIAEGVTCNGVNETHDGRH